MIEIEGYLFTQEAADFIAKSKANGLRVKMYPPVDDDFAACVQCGGAGTMFLFAYSPEPIQAIDGHDTVSWIDDKPYTGKHRSFHCPACNAKKLADRIRRIKAGNGLQPSEQAWRYTYLDGKPGKDMLTRYARNILAAQKPTGFATFYGGYGLGKSGTAKSLVAELSDRGVRAIYTTMANILEEARATFSGDEPDQQDRASELAVLLYYNMPQFLVIDEVDRINIKSAWVLEFAFTLLNKRYDRRHDVATLLVTNSQPDKMGREWEYLQDRQRDGQRIIVGGESLRGKKVSA